ncbi:hypothetical protein DMENIID0001_126060 [Sergentomyia squamirostris]
MTEEVEKKESAAPVVKKEKPNRRDRKKKDKVKPLTKVIIRRLPPSMSEETFREQINPIPDHDFFYFVPGDWSLGVMASSRAYINFLKQEDIFIFKDKFDGYVFLDSRGSEYPAVVEFAPFQGLPKNRARKRDSKSGTIETESHYLAFLESLKGEGGEKQESKLEFTYQFKDHKEIKSTPLLEYIATKRQEKREERKRKVEEKRRLREEEKQKKKIQVAKQIPASIAEQEKEAEDEIVVRAVKSRAGDKRTKKEKEKTPSVDLKKQEKPPLDEKAKAAKEERDRKRAEKDQQRKLERDRRNEERKKERSLTKAKSQDELTSTQDSGSVRKEVKKYSERRREQRQEKKTEVKVEEVKSLEETETKPAPADPPKKEPHQEKSPEKSNRQLKREKQREEREKQKEERQARRIRNKDRPSLQIYQPGRSRLSSITKKTSGDEQTPEDANPTTPPFQDLPVDPPAEALADAPADPPADPPENPPASVEAPTETTESLE